MSPNKISLSIAGLSILVTTPEDEEYVNQIAEELERNILAVLEKSVGASITNAVLLCAIEYLDGYKKSTRTANNMRSQIKDYLAEAANAKLEYDEERKRNNELNTELQALRNHLTRLATEGDSSGLIKQLRDDYNSANSELVKMRKRNAELITQNKTLSDKADAMNTYIAGQDREIARLSSASEDLNANLVQKTTLISNLSDKISGYEGQMSSLVEETERLKTELNVLEQLITAESEAILAKSMDNIDFEKASAAEIHAQPALSEDEADALHTAPETDAAAELPLFGPAAEEDTQQVTKHDENQLLFDAPEENAEQISEIDDNQLLFDEVSQESSDVPAEPAQQPSVEQTNEEILSQLRAKLDKPTKSSKKDARDFDAAIKQVNDRKTSSDPRPIKDYDIDIGDTFSDFKIDPDENIVGFSSVRNTPGYMNEDPKDMTVASEQSAGRAIREDKTVYSKTMPPDDEAFDFGASFAMSFDSNSTGSDAVGQDDKADKKPRGDKKRKPENNLLDQLEPDSDMPNLSWTLDV